MDPRGSTALANIVRLFVDAYNLTRRGLGSPSYRDFRHCNPLDLHCGRRVFHSFFSIAVLSLKRIRLSFFLYTLFVLFLPYLVSGLGYGDGHFTMSVMNASYASPVADAAFAKINAIAPEGFVQRLLAGVNAWTVVFTLLIGAVLYDQGESTRSRNHEIPRLTQSQCHISTTRAQSWAPCSRSPSLDLSSNR